MSTLQKTTRLEAINSMMTSIGEAPISSLTAGSMPQDAAIASFVLDEVNREVQAIGWHFNREYNVSLALDSNNKIPVATTVLSVDIPRSESADTIVIRGDFLYNTSKQDDSDRFVFDGPIEATVTYLLDLTELPQPAREYIVARASRIFQERVLGSADLSRVLASRELDAKGDLLQYETTSGNNNYLDFPGGYISRYI